MKTGHINRVVLLQKGETCTLPFFLFHSYLSAILLPMYIHFLYIPKIVCCIFYSYNIVLD